jgi:hypothetical protein
MRRLLLASAVPLFQAIPARAQISVGLDLPAYPDLVRVPGYTVDQRRYAGERDPRADEQQRSIRSDNHRDQPRDVTTRRHLLPPQYSRSRPGRSDDNDRDARPPPNDRAHGKGNEDRGQERQ